MKKATKDLSRRQLLKATPAAVAAATVHSACGGVVGPASGADAVKDMLRKYVVARESIDRFLDPKARVWAKFHPEYGYLLRNAFLRDGAHGSSTLGRYEQGGYRRQVNFRGQPCRINTYGNSFTQGHQVSDGETWQEVLSAHFCEPVRNFGIGGFGVYQAYLRLLEIEATPLQSEYLIFNIWGDDHLRSINAWRWLTFTGDVLDDLAGPMFHANPWRHARIDAESGKLVHEPNPCPTRESLYRLTEEEFVVEHFSRDPVVHALAAIRTGKVGDRSSLESMAAACGFQSLNLSSPDAARTTANQLYHAYAARASSLILDELAEFAATRDKKLFVLLSHPSGSVWHHCSDQLTEGSGFVAWHHPAFKDHLAQSGLPFVDTIEKHMADFETFCVTPKEYVDRYYIGHYNPTGNHFFAHSVRGDLVKWLSPKPPAYRAAASEDLLRFDGYLPG